MTTTEVEVYQWRKDEALKMGFTPEQSSTVAESHIDLHELRALLKKGCPHALALEILA